MVLVFSKDKPGFRNRIITGVSFIFTFEGDQGRMLVWERGKKPLGFGLAISHLEKTFKDVFVFSRGFDHTVGHKNMGLFLIQDHKFVGDENWTRILNPLLNDKIKHSING